MGPALATASAQDHDNHYQNQDHNRDNQHDWSNNSFYQMGQREAARDRQHNKQRKHRHHYKNDDDRQAYTAGYQNSWSHDSDQDHRR